jgi:hypothetical protein
LDSVQSVSARVLDWVHSKRAGQELEIKRLNATADPNQPQQIRITGGLPELPGTEIILPKLNGHQLELSAANDPVNGPPPEESKP